MLSAFTELPRLFLRRVLPGFLILTQLFTPVVLQALTTNNAYAQQVPAENAALQDLDSDPFGMLQQTALYEFDARQGNRYYDLRNTSLGYLRGENNRVEKVVPFAKLNRGQVDNEVWDGLDFLNSQVQVGELLHKENYALNSFYVKNRSRVLFGKYLVFIEIQPSGQETLSMIDLESYGRELGQTKLPILRLPLDQKYLKDQVLTAAKSNGRWVLMVGGRALGFEYLDHFAKTQEVYFNMMANLHNPKTYLETQETIKDLDNFVAGNLDAAVNEMSGVQNKLGILKPSDLEGPLAKAFDQRYVGFLRAELGRVQERKAADAAKVAEDAAKGIKPAPVSEDAPAEKIADVTLFEKAALQFANAQDNNRKFTSRLRFLVSKLQNFTASAGQNLGSIYNTLASRGRLGTAMYQKHQDLILKVSMRNHLDAQKLFKRSQRENPLADDLIKVGMAAGLGTVFLSTPMGQPLVSLMAPIANATADWFSQMVAINWEGLKQSSAFMFKGRELWNHFTTPEQMQLWAWRGVGIFVTLGTVVASCHFAILAKQIYSDWHEKTGNSVKKLWGWMKECWEISERGGSFEETDSHWKKLTSGVRKAIQEFPAFLIDREKSQEAQYIETLRDEKGRKKVEFKPEDDARASMAIDDAEKKSGWMMRLWTAMSPKRMPNDQKIGTFPQALAHALFSMSAFTNVQAQNIAPFYTNLFYVRSYLRFPLMDWMWIRYPNSVRVAMSRNGEVVLPTDSNGGLRTRLQQWGMAWRARGGSFDYQQLKSWEAAVVDVEKGIEVKALSESFRILMSETRSRQLLRTYYSSGGVSKVSDETLFELSRTDRKRFEAIYTVVSENMMREFLMKLCQRKAEFIDQKFGDRLPQATLAELKQATLGFSSELKMSGPNEADELFARAQARVNFSAAADSLIKSGKIRWIDSYRFQAARKLDPNGSLFVNRQAKRIHSTQKQLKNPAAVLRAVRASITELLVDKPLETIQMVLCLLAVNTGVNVLFQNEAFGANSIFGWGKFAFLYNFVWSSVFSYLSSTAMKLQFDEANQDDFGEVPTGQAAKKSFFWNFWQNTFKNKKNSFKKNHINQSQIVLANIPSYLTLTIPVQMALLGRVELDTIIGGYGIYFATPLYTVDLQLDQAFEFTAAYDLKDIPEDLRNHPMVVDWMKGRQLRRRILFQVGAKALYQNPIFFATNTIMTLPGVDGGKQLMRLLFFGYTPTELVVNPARALGNAVEGIPVVAQVGKIPEILCETFLTKGYEDGTKLIK